MAALEGTMKRRVKEVKHIMRRIDRKLKRRLERDKRANEEQSDGK